MEKWTEYETTEKYRSLGLCFAGERRRQKLERTEVSFLFCFVFYFLTISCSKKWALCLGVFWLFVLCTCLLVRWEIIRIKREIKDIELVSRKKRMRPRAQLENQPEAAWGTSHPLKQNERKNKCYRGDKLVSQVIGNIRGLLCMGSIFPWSGKTIWGGYFIS